MAPGIDLTALRNAGHRSSNPKPRLLWVGLGKMGRPMVTNLINNGGLTEAMTVYNRTMGRSRALEAELGPDKVQIAALIEDGVAQADIIFTMLANDQAVKEVMEVMLQGNVRGKLFIDCSTIHPKSTEAIGEMVTSHGAEFVAAPVCGPPPEAKAARLIAILGGPADSVAKARPWFKGVMARAEIDLSNKSYSATLSLKLTANTFVFSMLEQLAEAHTLGEKLGVEPEKLHEFVDLFYGGMWTMYSDRMISDPATKASRPLISAALAQKDAGYLLSMAEGVGVELGIANVGWRHLLVAQKYKTDADIGDIYGAVRVESGLPFERHDDPRKKQPEEAQGTQQTQEPQERAERL